MKLAVAIVLASSTASADPPTLKPSEIAAKTKTALATVDAKAPRGVGSELFWIEKTTDAEVKALRAELPKHFKVLEERVVGAYTGFTIEATSGARATIALGPDRGRVIATLRPTSITPPGACVAVPDVKHHVTVISRGIDHRGESFEGETRWQLDTARLLDVDGDGMLDAFVPVAPKDNSCPEEVSYRVFVMRGACGHEIGTVGPGSLSYDAASLPLAASGYRPIVIDADRSTHGPRGIPEHTTTTRRFEVAGGRYKQVGIKTSGGACHHCAVWFCNKD